MFDRKILFDAVRGSLFGGSLSQKQVNGINAIIDAFEKRGLLDTRFLAYVLATTFHETARTMQPIKEYGRGRGRKYGQVYKPTGQVYYGRGYVQLTWYRNYQKLGKLLGVDLVNNPDLALEPEIAADIIWEGMIRGLFTGKALKHYIKGDKCDFVGARRIVNGTDKAQTIANYATKFLEALEAAETVPVPKPNPKSIKDKTYRDPVVTGGGTVSLTTIGQTLVDQSKELEALSAVSPYLQYVVIGIGVVGALLTAYAIIRKLRKGDNDVHVLPDEPVEQA